MRFIKDKTGRFLHRPFYEEGEIDHICEKIVYGFLIDKYGEIKLPISTEDIEILIEQNTEDFDPYCDLSAEGKTVEGLTLFQAQEKPFIGISNNLMPGNFEKRRRSTMAHELGHAVLHDPLAQEKYLQYSLFEEEQIKIACKREQILYVHKSVDWVEWQAGYAGGAFLMPVSSINKEMGEVLALAGQIIPLPVSSINGKASVSRVVKRFSVSSDAARVRLRQLGFLTNNPSSEELLI